MEIRKNWRSSGMDAVFVHAGDVIQRLMPGKIMMLYNGTWTNVSATIPDLDHYLFGDLTFSDDQTIFAVYKRYNMRVTDSATVDDNGVVRFDYDDNTGTWNHTYVNNGLGNTGGNRAYGEGISFNQFSGRIFLAARDINSPDGIKRGSLYYLPSSNDSVWTPAFSTSDSTSFRDVRCIGQSRYGNTMYIGTRGHSLAGYGTVLKCTDPSSTPLVVTPMVNSTINNCYFDFDVPAGFTWTDLVANQRLTHVKSLTVDPENKDKVYVGLSCYNFMAKEGLWFYDGTDWEHLSDGEIFQGMGVACSTIRTTTPKRLAIGTDGQEIYYTAVVTPVDPPNIKPPKISLRSHMVHGEPGSTMFRFSLPKPDMVMLKIFDIRGRVIKTQNLGHMSQGPQQVVWDGITGAGGRSASGVYFAKIITENDEGNVRFVVVR